MTSGLDQIESWKNMPRLDLRPLTPNERFWLEVIRLASWNSDPAPTLERVQQIRRILQPGQSDGSVRPQLRTFNDR